MDASRDWSMDEAGHRLCWTTRVPRLDRTFLTTVRVYYMVAENAIRVCTMRARSHFLVNGPRFRGRTHRQDALPFAALGVSDENFSQLSRIFAFLPQAMSAPLIYLTLLPPPQ